MTSWGMGAQIEKLYCKKLEALGWITRRFPHAIYGKQDIWGCDIVAKKAGKTLWIQVKGRTKYMPSIEKDTAAELASLWAYCGKAEKVCWVGYRAGEKKWKEVYWDGVKGAWQDLVL